ncbi:MAG: hypothetical protein LBL17_01550 [Coxiellaceae bacterium]|jgi:hypothetical protein|nr:hypothetical protein [Coxiellaceae bacterium]
MMEEELFMDKNDKSNDVVDETESAKDLSDSHISSLQIYLREIGFTPLLSAKEEIELAEKVKV